jgi:hypothetical protein
MIAAYNTPFVLALKKTIMFLLRNVFSILVICAVLTMFLLRNVVSEYVKCSCCFMQVFQDMEGHGAYYTNLMNEGTYNENYEDILDTPTEFQQTPPIKDNNPI